MSRYLITGGTGTLGKALVARLLAGDDAERVVVFSRDELKQHEMRTGGWVTTDEVIYGNDGRLEFRIGDVRNPDSVAEALRGIDVVIHAAAMKQVPACEYAPREAFETNVLGAENIVRAIMHRDLPVRVVVGISTDKACEPINVYGMTKALMERVFVTANLRCPTTRFVCVRYGNVMSSRGSVLPLFQEQVRRGGPITVTDPRMTRFLMTKDHAVDTVLYAAERGQAGGVVVPRADAANIGDLATMLAEAGGVEVRHTGVRPGEKLYETLVGPGEVARTSCANGYCHINPMLPELALPQAWVPLGEAYTSQDCMPVEALRRFLAFHGILS